MSVEYTLTELEQKLCSVGAEMRYNSNRTAGVKNDKRANERSNKDVDGVGLAGELAVAKHLNLYPDLTIFTRKGGADLITHTDKSIDVKTTFYDNGKLLAHCGKTYKNINIFVLVTAKFYPTVVIRGWVRREQLINDDNIGGIGYGKAYLMEQDELNSIDLLCFNPKFVNNKIPEMYPDNSADDLSGYRI